MSHTRRIGAVAGAAALVLTMAACSADEPDAVAEHPTDTGTTQPAPEPTEDAGTAEPAEQDARDSRGLVDRTGTWTEYDETTIAFPGRDEGRLEELAAYDGADAALDFLYLASEHETAFHTMPAHKAHEYPNDGSAETVELVSQWWLGDQGGEEISLGAAATPHVSPLSLIHSLGSGDPYEGTIGFTATGHGLRIEHISGTAFTETEREVFASLAGDRPLSGPVVVVDAVVAGEISGADGEGTPRSIDVPFSTVSVVVTLDADDGAWKVLDLVTYSQEDFVGTEPGDELGD